MSLNSNRKSTKPKCVCLPANTKRPGLRRDRPPPLVPDEIRCDPRQLHLINFLEQMPPAINLKGWVP